MSSKCHLSCFPTDSSPQSVSSAAFFSITSVPIFPRCRLSTNTTYSYPAYPHTYTHIPNTSSMTLPLASLTHPPKSLPNASISHPSTTQHFASLSPLLRRPSSFSHPPHKLTIGFTPAYPTSSIPYDTPSLTHPHSLPSLRPILSAPSTLHLPHLIPPPSPSLPLHSPLPLPLPHPTNRSSHPIPLSPAQLSPSHPHPTNPSI